MSSEIATSQPTKTDLITPNSISADSCPISDLLGKRVVDMSEQELLEHVNSLRRAREQPQVLRTLLKGKEKAPAKPRKSKAIDVNSLFG